MRHINRLFIAAAALALTGSAFAATFYPSGYYLDGGVGLAKLSYGPFSMANNNAELVNQTSTDKPNEAGAYLALGYATRSLPLEFNVSYLYRLPFQYNQNALFKGRADSFSSKVQSQALFANVVFDANFNNGNDDIPVIPFVTAGYGVAMNTVNLSVTNAAKLTASGQDHVFNGAWQVGAGTHIYLTPNLFFDLGVYHQSLGKVVFGPWGDKTDQKNYQFSSDSLTNNDVRIGFHYVFGDQHVSPSLINGV